MLVSGWVVGSIIVLALLVFLTVRWLNKYKFLNDREPISLIEMHQRDMENVDVNYEIFEKVFNAIGRAYKVDPKILRSSDKLKILYDLDSWNIDEGTEMLNVEITKDFNITDFEVEPETIYELIVGIEKQIVQ
jgi:hypothetical protein